MSFVDVPTTTVIEREIDPALADKMEAGRLNGSSRLATLREERSLSATDLARLAGLSHDEIIAFESGKPLGAMELHAIAAALDVPADMLVD
ncbi:hypothetical protein C3941_14255 [Kaistia algarum]|uniref:helix-turn-helix domain-containing protein n=1 Tax=Kaistia algarum TaxID=2083279 RepID=UPI000CE8042B|nr:helix-turn-helix transcriptional regulator [Kaistia algarum]MCX5513618.1 helix-turn-helix transcriptional regulator [Kaistia algarum]PPE79497.1 hypothetical protein C3941_14255 [Kaistia algarum]